MFNCLASEEEIRARKIMKSVKKGMKNQTDSRLRDSIKILILGNGDSGKSTFVKQMKILHSGGFDENERKLQIPAIHRNLLSAPMFLHRMISSGEITSCLQKTREVFENVLSGISDSYSSDYNLDDMKLLCECLIADPELYNLVKDRVYPEIPDNAPYFLENGNFERILCTSYLPTDQDILQCRTPTSGIVNHLFNIKDKGSLRVVDVGGQKVERKRWIHQFNGSHFLMFVSDCSAFNKPCETNPDVSSLQESIIMILELATWSCFKEVATMIFFNKIDLLESKLKRLKFNDYETRYTGDNSFEDVKVYVESLVEQLHTQKPGLVFVYFTHGTNTQNFKLVFDSVLQKIYYDNVNQYST